MIGDRLELPSARGDQTISSVRIAVCGSSAGTGSEIIERGLPFTEGRPLLTTNLLQAADDASSADGPGVITVAAVPTDFYLGYAAFTTAYIDRAAKLVQGAPLRYADSRNQLALYLDPDTEAARRRIEMEAAAGASVSQPSFVVDQQHIIGQLEVTEPLKRVLSWLKVSINSMEPVDSGRINTSLEQLFECREPAQAVLIPSTVRSLVVGTVEALTLTRMRQMRWQGLAALGYRFTEDEAAIDIEIVGVIDQRHRIDEFGRLIASSAIFSGELTWLKVYTTRQLELMRVELDGAELEAA